MSNKSYILALFLASQASISNQKAMTGTNIGGWLVLEPWITPSFFYKWLGKTNQEGVAMDSYTVCETLGEDANDMMQAHWDSWYTE